MERLTVNKNVSEMNMVELAHNSCFAKDRNATYRDFECEIDARDFIRKIGKTFGIFEDGCDEMTDNEAFDEVMTDYLQYGYDEKEGLLALLYRNLWAQANLYERLKYYEDLEEKGLLPKLPCKVGDTVYSLDRFCGGYAGDCPSRPCEECTDYQLEIYEGKFALKDIDDFGKTVFLTQAEAEEALKGMEGSNNG